MKKTLILIVIAFVLIKNSKAMDTLPLFAKNPSAVYLEFCSENTTPNTCHTTSPIDSLERISSQCKLVKENTRSFLISIKNSEEIED